MISFQSFLEMSFLCFFLVFKDTISKLWCILDFILRLFNWRIAFLCSSNYKIFREIVSEFISMHFEFFKTKLTFQAITSTNFVVSIYLLNFWNNFFMTLAFSMHRRFFSGNCWSLDLPSSSLPYGLHWRPQSEPYRGRGQTLLRVANSSGCKCCQLDWKPLSHWSTHLWTSEIQYN